ncbi:Uncharacterised protein [BD1-7 clade bacterium]|uniref:6-phosphogluconolactonase n=1 Tax=BD1-7 clade bacterium TaxID=2029982 RepID=A0A5S9QAR9_9GAMM|nr:Uncharacterised protein [BD1-7 clade bacterium]CAA0114933.1 Uncharacterised protein [BD1-7 clade bacterium]
MNRSEALIRNMSATLLSVILVAGCSDENDSSGVQQTEPDTKYLYTSTNSPSGNRVVAFSVATDGLLQELGSFPTGSPGDADEGDFDGQGAIRVIGDYLLVANAGDVADEAGIEDGNGSISVMKIAPQIGELTRIDQNDDIDGIQNIDSQGIRPVSLSVRNMDGQIWVVVANQQSNSACFDISNATGVADCIDQFGNPISDVLSAANTGLRNIVLYRFDEGKLAFVRRLDTYAAGYGGPSQVSFSPDGTKLAVTSWGIGHIAFPAMPNFQMASRVYLYDVALSSTTPELSNRRYFENPGISGSVGFSWSSDSRFVYVSSFALSQEQLTSNLIALDTLNTDTVFTSDSTSEPSGAGYIPSELRPGACWTWLTPDDSRLYSVAFATNTVGVFDVEGSDLERQQLIVRTQVPGRDTKDIYVAQNGRFAYVLGGIFSHTVSMYDINADGRLIEKTESPLQVQASRPNGNNVSDLEHTYLGIGGYPAGYTGF